MSSLPIPVSERSPAASKRNKSLIPWNKSENLPSVEVKKQADGKIITTEHFGVEAVIDGRPGRFSKIIPKGAILPASNRKVYFPVADYQESVIVRCFKGEYDDVARNIMLGEFTISGILPRTREQTQGIAVTFSINRLGVVLVDAVEIENPDNHLKVKLEYHKPDGLVKSVAKGIAREVAGMLLPGKK
ncbi:MAG TPA: Hsp70 family protein [bacterium]|nr:Hsp70 family protein [bacterium]